MKKLTLTVVCTLAVAGAAFAQGNLQWNNFSASAIRVQTNSTVYSPLFGGGSAGGGAAFLSAGNIVGNQFYFELLYSSALNTTGVQLAGASAPSNSFATLFGGGWRDTGLQATNGAGGTLVGNPSVPAGTVSGMNPGATNNIILVGWSSNLGSSWLTVSNELATGSYTSVLNGSAGFFGVSVAGFLMPFDSVTSPGALPFGTAQNAQGLPINSPLTELYLLPVPEPTSLALAGLGGLSLLLFRRQRK